MSRRCWPRSASPTRRRGSRRGTSSTCSTATRATRCSAEAARRDDVVAISALTGEGVDALLEHGRRAADRGRIAAMRSRSPPATARARPGCTRMARCWRRAVDGELDTTYDVRLSRRAITSGSARCDWSLTRLTVAHSASFCVERQAGERVAARSASIARKRAFELGVGRRAARLRDRRRDGAPS